MAMGTATIHYPPLGVSSVAEMLDPSKPLVKSNAPLTRPVAPRFVNVAEAEKRRQLRELKKSSANEATGKIYTARLNERKFLKAQYEFDREKRIAEQTIYRKEKQGEWKNRYSNSPFLVDLVADNERIEEEMYVKSEEDKRRQQRLAVKKKQVKSEIIIKALSEVSQSEQRRAQIRAALDDKKRKQAAQDLKKVDDIFERKKRDQLEVERDRMAKLELKQLQQPPYKQMV
eukprot:NODE_278_length_1027_cov_432.144444_g271_i0.p1 GENE.NODE_278_length_1027_cov_432.144444_g271_i0~~NODE_278_length_1027_cov_432.144444_g271_i0.p1  ORF type:complete len:230 (-),score=64.40 NODE_278_length_1027_cov_432.144444_g271_i0:245-934(-)